MAQVQVPWSYLNQSNFPSICVVTGVPTSARGDFYQRPPQSAGARLLGYWIFGTLSLIFFAWRHKKTEFSVNLPIAKSVWVKIHRTRKFAAVAIISALVSAFTAILFSSLLQKFTVWMAFLWVLAAAGVLSWAVLTWQMNSVYPRVDDQEQVWVTLRPVSDAFANAVSLALSGETRPSPDIGGLQNVTARAYGSGHR
jgi:hypothetical protein